MTAAANAQQPVAVVTGGASGIGAAAVATLAGQGCAVAIVDLDPKPGLGSLAIRADLGVWDEIDAAVAEVAEHFGRIDHLVNCAASFNAAGLGAQRGDWDRSLGVNVAGSARMTAQAVQHMAAGSSVVNVSSVSAHVAQPDRWTYNSSKAAIVGLTRCQALDLAPRGIRVNVVSPGWIWTPEVARAAGGDRSAHEPAWGAFHMLGRLGEPDEVAAAIWFLLSPAASFITATELAVDGGYLGMSAEGSGQSSTFAATKR